MAADIVPREILERKKQPYRAPDAVCFFGSKAPDYIRELMSERAVADSGVFEPRAVTALVSKMKRLASDPINPPTTADNMAMVAILSVQLLHHHLLSTPPAPPAEQLAFDVDVSFLSDSSPEQ
jgi:asparagine synthase (glutamine-hydrolysing)